MLIGEQQTRGRYEGTRSAGDAHGSQPQVIQKLGRYLEFILLVHRSAGNWLKSHIPSSAARGSARVHSAQLSRSGAVRCSLERIFHGLQQ